jgi:Asp-tRNA(Asn)/Glu-tRNA(Gln) amidotransferase A subunit family amidase
VLAELSAAVRERRISAADLVRRSLERIDAVDRALGAVVARRDEPALREAIDLTERIAAGEDVGSLAGLPVLVKDVEDVVGMRTTYGSLLHAEDAPAQRDDLVVRRLRDQGAIVVGKTNVPEYAFDGFTANRVFGPTRNPWVPERSPGGSSGGAGAALAAGLAPIATATDGGGSVRIPASFCGLAGLKPTQGIVGRDPIPIWLDLSTPGPLASSIADVRLLLSTMAGPAAGDPGALPAWVPKPGLPLLPPLVLALERNSLAGPLPSAVADAFSATLRSIVGDLGIDVEPIGFDRIYGDGNIDDDWFTTVAVEHAHFLGRATIEANAERFMPGFREAMETGLATDAETYLAARRRRYTFCRALDELLGEDGLLVQPTMPTEGWDPEGATPDDPSAAAAATAYNTQAANITGHPALSVPAGTLPDGLPFGLQVTGPRFRDGLVLEFGARWEQHNPWRPIAPGYEPFDV